VIHELPLERRTLHGHFSRDLEPVLTIDPGSWPDALALASLVVDVRITQVVNGTVGVHALLAYPPPP
jgi:acetamidase/formamidase